MKLFYTEEILQDCIRRINKGNMVVTIKDCVFQEPMTAVMLQRNNTSSTTNCILASSVEGILLIRMDRFKVEKYYGFEYLRYSDMQGIQIKEKWLSVHIIIQCTNGMKYKLQVVKRNTKHLPNQHEYMEHLISNLEARNLHDMKNEMFKKNRKAERKNDAVYLGTLIPMEIAGCWAVLRAGGNTLLLIIVPVAVVV
ncbi:MAG: hypothetical protein PHX08_26270, partial [Lachnospiraceae bacterium]|nr:hypothetical protein [Lachnospiraceae bacterium]